MAPTEIKNGDSIELYTELPEISIPIVRPLFSCMGSVWNFELAVVTSPYLFYTASLKTENTPLLKRFQIDVEVRVVHNNKSLGKRSVSVTRNGLFNVWDSSVIILRKNLPQDYRTGNALKFLFSFHLPSDPVIKMNSKSHDKSVQTPSYIDNNYLLKGFSQDIENLLNEDSNHDVEFICGEETVNAHKNVLCCRSDILATMLHSEMIEGQTGRVIIQDMDATLFTQFRNCLYTGVLPNLTVDTAIPFYEAGDKYNVVTLKKQCADFLIDHLSSDNAYGILILAEQHSDPVFKKGVIEYFIKEKLPCMGEKWTRFSKEHSKLAVEVLNLFCNHLLPK